MQGGSVDGGADGGGGDWRGQELFTALEKPGRK